MALKIKGHQINSETRAVTRGVGGVTRKRSTHVHKQLLISRGQEEHYIFVDVGCFILKKESEKAIKGFTWSFLFEGH